MTPFLYGVTTAGSPTYSAQGGTYTRVGNQAIIKGRLTLTSKGGMVGAIRIGGLPFTSANNNDARGCCIFNTYSNVSLAAGTILASDIVANVTYCRLNMSGASNATSNVQDTNLTDSSTIQFNINITI